MLTRFNATVKEFASTSVDNYGILVKKSGASDKSLTLLHNELQTKIDKLNNDIDSWKTKMSKKVDFYTKQFTTLEKLINTMNAQSSALMGFMR